MVSSDPQLPLGRIILILIAVTVLVPTVVRGDTPDPRIVLGPWVRDLRVAPGMNAAGRNLRGTQFVGQDLRNAVFDGADLSGVLFWDCDLSEASFRGADLTRAVIRDCRELDGTDFTDALIRGMEVESAGRLSPEQLKSTRSYRTRNLAGCMIVGVDSHAGNKNAAFDFRNADLRGATLIHGDFRECDFRGAVIDGITITACKMRFEQLASTNNFREKALRNIKISATFEGALDFSNIDLTGTELSFDGSPPLYLDGATVTRCTFGAQLTREALTATKNYREGNLIGITFWHVDLTDWNLAGQNLTGCGFFGCNLTAVNLKDAVITDLFVQDVPVTTTGLTLDQIKSTWNYKHGRMAGIRLPVELAKALAKEAEERNSRDAAGSEDGNAAEATHGRE